MPTFAEIQAEQERDRRPAGGGGVRGDSWRGGNNSSNNNNNNNNRGYHRGNSNRSDRGGGGRGRRGINPPDRSNLPLEQGCICSLKDKFGFIYCAEREEEIFFHYSEVANTHPDSIQIDDEVEFRVGGSRDNPDKLAAYQVNQLPAGTIQWEFEEHPGTRFQGLIDRPVPRSDRGDRNNRGRRDSDNNNSETSMEGTIRLLVPDDADGGAKEERPGQDTEANSDTVVATTTDGPTIKFRASDFDPDNTNNNDTSENPTEGDNAQPVQILKRMSSVSSRSSNRLYRGDLVEFSIFIEKRTKQKYAKNIVVMQSEKERARLAKEQKMLDEATLEQGVVTALKADFGFLKSNKRREDVFFHYSEVQLPPADGEGAEDDEEHELKVGQDMEFLVVAEDQNDNNKRASARKVIFLPKGSVQFRKVLARGVTGLVTIVPRANSSGSDNDDPSLYGRVRLLETVVDDAKSGEDGQACVVDSVMLHSKDSPGGVFTCSRGSSLGLWIREGDKLLFDVYKEFMDGSYHARPTKCLLPVSTASGDADVETAPVDEKENDQPKQEGVKGKPTGPSVRLIGLSLAGRAEGIVHTIKESYGFIHLAERPVDAHFKQFELLPDELQVDLRRNMGLPAVISGTTKADMMGFNSLSVGTEVQFDLSIAGTIMTMNHHQHRNKRGGNQSNQHERENLKAQRLLVLPQSTILQTKELATKAKGVITKEDPNQPYAGTVELDDEVPLMTLEEFHPLVVQMIDEFLNDTARDSIVFHDLQSAKEEDVIVDVLEQKATSKLSWTHIPQPGQTAYAGRFCIRRMQPGEQPKAEAANAENTEVAKTSDTASMEKTPGASDDKEEKDGTKTPTSRSLSPAGGRSKSPKRGKKKKAKQKLLEPAKLVRFDKSSLTQDAKTDVPPGIGDVVTCDVHHVRRTGKVQLHNISVADRKTLDPGEATKLEGQTGVGVVKEVVLSRKFGFISVVDDNAGRRELLFFHFACVIGSPNNNKGGTGVPVIRKGDEVKFHVGTEKNGKRVAVDVEIVAKGKDLPGKADKNACKGYILVEPTDTNVGAPLRQSRSFTKSRDAPLANGGRWDKVKDDNSQVTAKQKDGLSSKGDGVILLLEDPGNVFIPAIKGDKQAEQETELGAMHVHYKSAGLSVQDNSVNSARRGDLVSFVKTKGGGGGVRDIRVVERGAAPLVRGHLESIDQVSRKASFVVKGEKEERYNIDLNEIVSCDSALLKDMIAVEGILHDGSIRGICRTIDLRLESKLGTGKKERPKLNLTVKKDRAGTIMAQSMMANGPDGTTGFKAGWTKRLSRFAKPWTGATEGTRARSTSKEEQNA